MFDAYAFPTGMEQILYGSSSGKDFTYSVRMEGDASGATVDVSGAANLDAALSQIHRLQRVQTIQPEQGFEVGDRPCGRCLPA